VVAYLLSCESACFACLPSLCTSALAKSAANRQAAGVPCGWNVVLTTHLLSQYAHMFRTRHMFSNLTWEQSGSDVLEAFMSRCRRGLWRG
jgi:hypothetical protein